MTDIEMLELAAKAAGIEVAYSENCLCMIRTKRTYDDSGFPITSWSTLDDNGDALCLAVQLGMNIDTGVHPVGFTCASVVSGTGSVTIEEYHNDNAMAATRRAIVRAAAQIGAQM